MSFAHLEARLHVEFAQKNLAPSSPAPAPAQPGRPGQRRRRKSVAPKTAAPVTPAPAASPELPVEPPVEPAPRIKVPLLPMSESEARKLRVPLNDWRAGYTSVLAASITDVPPGAYIVVSKSLRGPKDRKIPAQCILYQGSQYHTLGDADGNFFGGRVNRFGKFEYKLRFLPDLEALAAAAAAAAAQVKAAEEAKAASRAKDRAEAAEKARKRAADREKARADKAKAAAAKRKAPASTPKKKKK